MNEDNTPYKTSEKPIQCAHCGFLTIMEVIAEGANIEPQYLDPVVNEYGGRIRKIEAYACPNCHELNIVYSSYDFGPFDHYDEFNLGEPKNYERKVVYPSTHEFSDTSEEFLDIQESYREALICFQLGLFTPCVVMCRKTLEMLCHYFISSGLSQLYRILDEMRRKGMIDHKLYEWANTLRIFGNEAVHPFTRFTKADAQDILDFTYSIVEYYIDFDFKFEKLLERQGQSKKRDLLNNSLSEEQVKALIESLSSSNTSIQYYAAVTLARNNQHLTQAISTLLVFIAEPGNIHREAAIQCLKSLGTLAVDDLIATLQNHPDCNVRETVANLLGEVHLDNLGGKLFPLMSALVEALEDSEQGVRFQAAHTLEKLGFDAVNLFTTKYTSESSFNDQG